MTEHYAHEEALVMMRGRYVKPGYAKEKLYTKPILCPYSKAAQNTVEGEYRGDFFKTARKLLGFSQVQMAEEFDITSRAVLAMENNQKKVPDELFREINAYLRELK